ncbi:MAG: YdiU family protein [Woeseiaceae bacterium]|nr:YdiU family protein [Woeseiaceae bacterium]
MIHASSFTRLPARFHARIEPRPIPAPELLAWNDTLARELRLESLADDRAGLARLLCGADTAADSPLLALVYAGHQFGHFVPQLGDGRAVLLGEARDRNGKRYDIQLKGAGRTPYSRAGDGKSSLGPVIREYVLSEAMHHLGIPTTRALAAVATGEQVYREDVLPGAVFTRVASSHLRVGTFEYFAARGDVEAVRLLAEYAIERHYPELADEPSPHVAFLRRVAERQAGLVADWMSVGFIHGVMNTDNTAIAGETLDYGPCAFMDEYRHDRVFSSIDRYGRYAYGNQAPVAQWNLARLAECLLLVCDERPALEEVIGEFPARYEEAYLARMRRKLGLITARDDDADLVADWLCHLENHDLDFTLAFRNLATRAGARDESQYGEFEGRWRARLREQDAGPGTVTAMMNSVNPLFIARNHRVEEAIRDAIDGDLSTFEELNVVLSRPFEEQPRFTHYAAAPQPHERVTQTFCGT